MPHNTPLAAIEALVAAREAGDVETALTCYTDNPIIVSQPGTVVSGTDAARESLQQSFSMNGTLTINTREILQGENSALHYSLWNLYGVGQDGERFDLNGVSTDVLEKQPDDGWLIAIDNPYGVTLPG
ncbi:MAG: hypothetical protein JWQ43_2547 [Glaciihabitans sp.]|nr:hypothetical protein [Glaciihabitans sp.]